MIFFPYWRCPPPALTPCPAGYQARGVLTRSLNVWVWLHAHTHVLEHRWRPLCYSLNLHLKPTLFAPPALALLCTLFLHLPLHRLWDMTEEWVFARGEFGEVTAECLHERGFTLHKSLFIFQILNDLWTGFQPFTASSNHEVGSRSCFGSAVKILCPAGQEDKETFTWSNLTPYNGDNALAQSS